ncbi:MAG TPA: AMP-binding protein [Solirubrobacteraceae bacterium]|nr:AMP-binding protein [Solirubrobacteraceae bacterium]
MHVEAWLSRAARMRPSWIAIETPEGSCTYKELHAAALAGAGELAARGVEPRRRVAIELPGGLAFARALHACLLLGAVAVPVDVRLATSERERLCRGADLVLREPLPARARARPRGASLSKRFAGGHDLDGVAAVIHTSGTSAAPRPVELTYGNFLWSAIGSAVALDRGGEDRWLCALPVSHVGGLSILIRSAIYATTAVVHQRFETEAVLGALREGRVSLVSLVGTTLARLLDAGLERPSALRCALTGGGPVPAALLARAREAGVPVSLTYGLTEACSQVSTVPVALALAAEAGEEAHAGPALFCTRLAIAPDGEILVAGPTVARGSRGADGWLHTGDLGELRGDGFLRVSGRKSETIVSGGENVAPAEVEAVLEAHPDVLEAAVIARADERWGEAVTAIVIARAGAEPAGESLRAYCAERLAPYKVPKQIELSSERLPRTASGKLLRRKLT